MDTQSAILVQTIPQLNFATLIQTNMSESIKTKRNFPDTKYGLKLLSIRSILSTFYRLAVIKFASVSL